MKNNKKSYKEQLDEIVLKRTQNKEIGYTYSKSHSFQDFKKIIKT